MGESMALRLARVISASGGKEYIEVRVLSAFACGSNFSIEK